MSNNKKLPNKPIRYIVNMSQQSGNEDNFVSYSTQWDKISKYTAYSLAVHTACRYFGTIYKEMECDDLSNPDRFIKVKDYSK